MVSVTKKDNHIKKKIVLKYFYFKNSILPIGYNQLYREGFSER